METIVRMLMDGRIEHGIDYAAQKTTFRVYGPKGWTDRHDSLADALREAGYNDAAEEAARIA
jgi:hypothetical protein